MLFGSGGSWQMSPGDNYIVMMARRSDGWNNNQKVKQLASQRYIVLFNAVFPFNHYKNTKQ